MPEIQPKLGESLCLKYKYHNTCCHRNNLSFWREKGGGGGGVYGGGVREGCVVHIFISRDK